MLKKSTYTRISRGSLKATSSLGALHSAVSLHARHADVAGQALHTTLTLVEGTRKIVTSFTYC